MNSVGQPAKPAIQTKKEFRSRPPGLLAKITCPHCWTTFPPHETKWVSAHPMLRDDQKVPEGGRRFLPTRFSVTGQAIDSLGELCSDLACPRCHLNVPRDVIELPSTFFSILGSPSSGKSYFLSSSLWQLRTLLALKFSISFEDSDPVANQKLQEYEEALFLNSRRDRLVALPKTELDGDLYEQIEIERGRTMLLPRPFIFRMRLLPSHPRADKVRRNGRTICLYDNAGEHFLPGAQNANTPGTRHLAVSKALFFVFDPTQHPQVRNLCRGKSHDPQLNDDVNSFRQDHILTEATRRIRAELGLRQDQRDQRPLIVVLSKYDAWAPIANGKPLINDSVLRETREGMNQFNVSQLKQISETFRKLMLKLAPEIVSSAEAFSEDVTYIPVSALGCSPQEMSGSSVVSGGSGRRALGVKPADINPAWAEIPLLYAIQRTIPGLIPQSSHIP
ncbi:MAG: hypothetical protein ACK50J_20765 [Planctomyces sp.]